MEGDPIIYRVAVGQRSKHSHRRHDRGKIDFVADEHLVENVFNSKKSSTISTTSTTRFADQTRATRILTPD
jgi:hypothetical protein